MEKKIVMNEVYSAQDLQALNGCTISAVYDEGENDEYLCLDCKDVDGNLFSFSITKEGVWNFYDSSKKSMSVEQFGVLAELTRYSDIESVHFDSFDPFRRIVINTTSYNSADRVITVLKENFPMLVVHKREWEFECELHSKYHCCDPMYNFTIVINGKTLFVPF